MGKQRKTMLGKGYNKNKITVKVMKGNMFKRVLSDEGIRYVNGLKVKRNPNKTLCSSQQIAKNIEDRATLQESKDTYGVESDAKEGVVPDDLSVNDEFLLPNQQIPTLSWIEMDEESKKSVNEDESISLLNNDHTIAEQIDEEEQEYLLSQELEKATISNVNAEEYAKKRAEARYQLMVKRQDSFWDQNRRNLKLGLLCYETSSPILEVNIGKCCNCHEENQACSLF